MTENGNKDKPKGNPLIGIIIFAVLIAGVVYGMKTCGSKDEAPPNAAAPQIGQTAPATAAPQEQAAPDFDLQIILAQFRKLAEDKNAPHIFDKGNGDDQYPLAKLARKAGNIEYKKEEGKTQVMASSRVKAHSPLVAAYVDFESTRLKVTMLTDPEVWKKEERQLILAIGCRQIELLLQALFQNKDEAFGAWSKLNNLWASFEEDERLTIQNVEQGGYRFVLSRPDAKGIYFWITKTAK